MGPVGIPPWWPHVWGAIFGAWMGLFSFKHLQKAWGIWPGNGSDNTHTHTQNVTLSSGVIWDNFQSFQNQSEPMDLSAWVLGFWKTQWIFSHPFCWAAWAASDLDLYTKSTWQHKDSTVVWSPAICQKLSRTKVHRFDFSVQLEFDFRCIFLDLETKISVLEASSILSSHPRIWTNKVWICWPSPPWVAKWLWHYRPWAQSGAP